MNSATYFFILVLWIDERVRSDCLSKILYRNGAERGSYFFARRLCSSTPAARCSPAQAGASPFRGATALRLHFVPDCPEIMEDRLE